MLVGLSGRLPLLSRGLGTTAAATSTAPPPGPSRATLHRSDRRGGARLVSGGTGGLRGRRAVESGLGKDRAGGRGPGGTRSPAGPTGAARKGTRKTHAFRERMFAHVVLLEKTRTARPGTPLEEFGGSPHGERSRPEESRRDARRVRGVARRALAVDRLVSGRAKRKESPRRQVAPLQGGGREGPARSRAGSDRTRGPIVRRATWSRIRGVESNAEAEFSQVRTTSAPDTRSRAAESARRGWNLPGPGLRGPRAGRRRCYCPPPPGTPSPVTGVASPSSTTKVEYWVGVLELLGWTWAWPAASPSGSPKRIWRRRSP